MKPWTEKGAGFVMELDKIRSIATRKTGSVVELGARVKPKGAQWRTILLDEMCPRGLVRVMRNASVDAVVVPVFSKEDTNSASVVCDAVVIHVHPPFFLELFAWMTFLFAKGNTCSQPTYTSSLPPCDAEAVDEHTAITARLNDALTSVRASIVTRRDGSSCLRMELYSSDELIVLGGNGIRVRGTCSFSIEPTDYIDTRDILGIAGVQAENCTNVNICLTPRVREDSDANTENSGDRVNVSNFPQATFLVTTADAVTGRLLCASKAKPPTLT